MMDILDTVFDSLGSVVSSIGSTISNLIGEKLGEFLYYIIYGVCDLIRGVYSVFSVFAGITKVNVNGEYQYLTNFFFQNDAVSGIYWGMVMIGVALVFGFAIVSVIRKIFDLYDKQQHSIGQILTGCFKSIIIMVSLTFFMSAAMSLTNELVRRVNYVFDENKSLTQKQEMVFTDEQFATMARIFNTIGNYSLNPSYNQRFNLNACYNEIRPDLLILQEQGVFDMIYVPPETAEGGRDETPSWQGALETLALAGNPGELMMDPYYPQISKALTDIMDIMRSNADFHPLESYRRQDVSSEPVSLDRVLFLCGTMDAANNSLYNRDPALDDAARGPFLHGDKDIYSLSDVSSVFNIQLGGISYAMILFLAFFVLRDLWRCLMTCASRMINIVGLYIIAPPVAASMPLDDGQKFKEWITSMVIQMLGIFGAIIPLRLVLLFIPMILDSSFVLLESTTANLFGKVALIVGLLEGVDRFGSVLTGILANNAGQAAIRAASMDEESDKVFDKYVGQHVPGMRNFFSDRYKAQQDAAKQSGGGSSGSSNNGIRGGSGRGGNANYGGYGGYGSPNGLPSRVPQAASMLASHLDGLSGGKGGLGDLPGGASALGNLGNSGSLGSLSGNTGGSLPGNMGSKLPGNMGSKLPGSSGGNLPGSTGGSLPGSSGGNLGAKAGSMGDLPGKAPTMPSMSNSPDGIPASSDPGQASVPGSLPANEAGSFSGGNEYGGNSYGGNDYGGDSYGGNDYGGSDFGSNSGDPGSLPMNSMSSFGGDNGGDLGGNSGDFGGNSGDPGSLPMNNMSSFGGDFGGVPLPSDMGSNIQKDYVGAFEAANTFGAQVDKKAAAYGLPGDPLSPSVGVSQFNNSMTNVQQSGSAGTGMPKSPIPQKQAPPPKNPAKKNSGIPGGNKKK